MRYTEGLITTNQLFTDWHNHCTSWVNGDQAWENRNAGKFSANEQR